MEADPIARRARATLLCSALVCLAVGVAAAPGGAETLSLTPGYEKGDVYALSLRTEIQTEATSSTGGGKALEKDLEMAYEATVEVLEVGDHGLPVREMHRGVRLDFERPGGSESLFGKETAYEVRHTEEGLRVFLEDRRVAPEVERVVARALADQFEGGLAPVLFAPPGPVEPGDTWELDPDRVRRFLEGRGIRVFELGDPATATLVAEPDGAPDARLVRYTIPIAWFELTEMPPNSKASASEGRVEGEIRIPAEGPPPPLHHASRLRIRVKGVASLSGLSGRGATSSWQIETARTTEQRTTAGGGVSASPAASGP